MQIVCIHLDLNDGDAQTMRIKQAKPDIESPNWIVEQQMQRQNENFFVIYDKLKTLKHEDHIAILRELNQFVPENKAEVIIWK